MKIFNSKYIIGLIAVALSLLTLNRASAQQLPLFSSYTQNPMLLSPSYAGALQEGQTARLMLGHRYQFTGFEGAPTTSLLAIDAPISNQKMGLGGILYTDKTGLIRQTGFGLNYSYKVTLSHKAVWHLGLSANAGQQALDMSSVRAVDESENILNLESANKVFVNGGFGTHLEAGNLQIGAAVHQLTENQLLYQNYISNTDFTYNQPAHFYSFASYHIPIRGDSFGITSLISTRYVQGSHPQYDVVLKAHAHQKAFITVGYRNGYALSMGVGAVLNNNLTLSYTYDHMINDAGPFTGGGNEFTLGYRFFKGNMRPSLTSTPAVVQQGLTQEEVDSIFQQRMQGYQNELLQLEEANRTQQNTIEELDQKIDSMQSVEDISVKEASQVVVQNGFVANHLAFSPSSAKLTPESEMELNRIAAYLELNPEISIAIAGYTDNTGNADANLLLSQKRALSVYDYLVNRGINGDRMEHQGYGSQKPIASNDSAEGRIKNRRVELKIID